EGPRTGGIRFTGDQDVLIQNTIIAGNTNENNGDIIGSVNFSGDYNLIGDTNHYAFAFTGTHNLLGIAPILNPLEDNDGPTFTHLPRHNSPARDNASPTDFPPVDQ